MIKKEVRRKVRKILLGLACVYLVLFGLRLLYSYSSNSRETESSFISSFFDNYSPSRKNYASEKGYRSKTDTKSESAPLQAAGGGIKYEKTATIKTRSAAFQDDEKKLRKGITAFEGIIQYEENTGQPGSRELHLVVGIPPENFDSCYAFMKKTGNVRSADIIKQDKTSEYKNLNARKASLEQTRNSLTELKKQSGRIEEFMMLQNRILEIEEQLQELGVELGDFSEENEFCTIRISLVEGKGAAPVSLAHRLKVCFEWTTQYYLMLIAITLLAAGAALLIALSIEKIWPLLGKGKNETGD